MSGDTFLLLVRLGFSLSLVFGLMWVAGRVLRGRAPLGARRSADHVEVLERKALSRGSSVAVVRVGNRVLALGVSDTNVCVLSELPEAAEALAIEAASTGVAAGDVTGTLPSLRTLPVTTTNGAVVVDAPSVPRPTTPSRHGWLDTLRDKTVRHIPT